MKSKEEFISLVDNKFFKHVTKGSLVKFENTAEILRENYLGEVYDELLRNVTEYEPQEPRKYIATPKNKYVSRMVPTFTLRDYCIYYYVVKSLEDFISGNRVENTFGGFRLSGSISSQEELEFELPGDSINDNAFNRYAWRVEYGKFFSKLMEHAMLLIQGQYQFAVKLDIANFYDNIRIDLLENKLKAEIGENNNVNDEVHILLNLLKFWNKKYDPSNAVGIPQDEVGECSRLLANFFLQDYDSFAKTICDQSDAVYLRYADDQILFTKSEQSARDLMYKLSEKLFEMSLNINCAKVVEFKSYNELNDYYGFSVMADLSSNEPNLSNAVDTFLMLKASNKTFRERSILRRILKFDLTQIDDGKRMRILSQLLEKEFLLSCDMYWFQKIYDNLRSAKEKANLITKLNKMSQETKFESFLISVERFKESLIAEEQRELASAAL